MTLRLVVCYGLLFSACSNVLKLDQYSTQPAPGTTSTRNEPEAPTEGPARPPPPPPGDPTPSGSGTTLAVAAKAFYFGTHDPTTGNQDLTGTLWREYGYDIDGVCTTPDTIQAIDAGRSQGGTCIFQQSNEGARKALRDGDRCRDNVFSSQLGGVFSGINTNFQAETNRDIILGSQTLILVLEDIDSFQNDPYVPAKVYVSTEDLTTGFTWNGSDTREVDSATVENNDLKKPKQSFLRGYISQGVWVNGPFNESPFDLPLLLNQNLVTLRTLSTAIAIAFDPATGDPIASTVASAVLSEELIGTLRFLAQHSLNCDTLKQFPLDAYLATIRSEVDLASGEPNFTNPSRACDAVSLGFKIQWTPIRVPTKAKPVQPAPAVCKSLGT